MDKYIDNSLVEPMDAIILLNDNYSRAGLKKGYIGVVVDNLIKSQNNSCRFFQSYGRQGYRRSCSNKKGRFPRHFLLVRRSTRRQSL